ncbi:hypothetical protein ACFOHY_15685 [Rhizobium rosettiformans]
MDHGFFTTPSSAPLAHREEGSGHGGTSDDQQVGGTFEALSAD